MTRSSIAAVFTGANRPLELREFPTPEPVQDEVLVRVLGCTVCGSDLHTLAGKRTVPVPTILGHEIVGRIEAFGPSSARLDISGQQLQIGDRVTWAVAASCGHCFFCQRCLPQKCESMLKYGHEAIRPARELTGGLAEHCLLVGGTSIVRLPDALSLSTACPASCAAATIAAAIPSAGAMQDSSVLILGAGMLGITACAMSRHLGARHVICFDLNQTRLARAETFGATRLAMRGELAEVVCEATAGRGVDIILELTGSPDAFDAAFPHARIGGTIVLVGAVFPSRPVALVMEQLVRRHLSLLGIHNYAPRHLQAAVQFLSETSYFAWDALVPKWVTLPEANDALDREFPAGCLRIGVDPSR